MLNSQKISADDKKGRRLFKDQLIARTTSSWLRLQQWTLEEMEEAKARPNPRGASVQKVVPRHTEPSQCQCHFASPKELQCIQHITSFSSEDLHQLLVVFQQWHIHSCSCSQPHSDRSKCEAVIPQTQFVHLIGLQHNLWLAQRMFNIFDVRRMRALNFVEFALAISALTDHSKFLDRIALSFDVYDLKADQKIDLSELRLSISSILVASESSYRVSSPSPSSHSASIFSTCLSSCLDSASLSTHNFSTSATTSATTSASNSPCVSPMSSNSPAMSLMSFSPVSSATESPSSTCSSPSRSAPSPASFDHMDMCPSTAHYSPVSTSSSAPSSPRLTTTSSPCLDLDTMKEPLPLSPLSLVPSLPVSPIVSPPSPHALPSPESPYSWFDMWCLSSENVSKLCQQTLQQGDLDGDGALNLHEYRLLFADSSSPSSSSSDCELSTSEPSVAKRKPIDVGLLLQPFVLTLPVIYHNSQHMHRT